MIQCESIYKVIKGYLSRFSLGNLGHWTVLWGSVDYAHSYTLYVIRTYVSDC